jgi:uncharacterized protein (DUF697 family)
MGITGVIGATVAGKFAFVEALKFLPVVGSAVGVLVGGPIAAGITKAFGTLYIDVLSDLVQSGKPMPDATKLTQLLTSAFKDKEAYYASVAKDVKKEDYVEVELDKDKDN